MGMMYSSSKPACSYRLRTSEAVRWSRRPPRTNRMEWAATSSPNSPCSPTLTRCSAIAGILLVEWVIPETAEFGTLGAAPFKP